MSTSLKVLILLFFTPKFEAYNPNRYEDNEPFTTEMQDAGDGTMFKPPQVLRVIQRSCSCGGYVLTKNQDCPDCHERINSDEKSLGGSSSEDAMKLFSRLRRLKPNQIKRILKPIHFHQIVRIAKRTSTTLPSSDDTNQLRKKTYTTRLGKRGKEEMTTEPKFRMMGKKAYMLRIGKRGLTIGSPNFKLLKLVKLLFILMSSHKRLPVDTEEVL